MDAKDRILDEKYRFAKELVAEAGDFLRQHLHDDLEIEEKTDFTDLVTHLDRQVQADMTQKILSRYPDDVIYGEESVNLQPLNQGAVWVIDPIDGTNNFVAQKTDFAVILAYLEDGQGQFGLIYDVMNDELYHGGGSFPVCLNQEVLPKYEDKPFHQGLIGMSAGLFHQEKPNFRHFALQSLGTRSYGSAGLSFCHVLTGRLMAHVTHVYPWDFVAAGILGQSLGYSLVRPDGSQPTYEGREYLLFVPTSKLEEVKGYLSQ